MIAMKTAAYSHCAPHRKPHGFSLIYILVTWTVIIGFVSLGVDFARVQLVKTQLQRTADAASRAAAAKLSTGVTATQNAAVTWAGYNSADTTSVVVDGTNDVDFGTWDTSAHTFTVLTGAARSGANAVRVHARRTAAKGNAVTLWFASLFGQSTIDVNTSAIAMQNPSYGTIGLNGIAFHTNTFVASYNSSVSTSPSTSSYNTNGVLQSNGTIGTGATAPNNFYGTLSLGPSASNTGATVHGTTNNLASNIPTPAAVTMTVVTNPGGVSQTPSLSSNVTWPGGTYYFTSFTMSNNIALTFSGPATIYLNGNATIHDNDSITAYSSKPANLVIYQAAGDTFTANDHDTFVGVMQSPGATLTVHDYFTSEGSLVFQSMSLHDYASIFYDESLGGTSGSSISLVK